MGWCELDVLASTESGLPGPVAQERPEQPGVVSAAGEAGGGRRASASIAFVGLMALGVSFIGPGVAAAAILTSQASLVDGQLTIVGSGAVPHWTM